MHKNPGDRENLFENYKYMFFNHSEDRTRQPLLVSSQPILDFLEPWLRVRLGWDTWASEVGIAVLLTALCGGYGVAVPMVQNYEQLHHAPPGVGPHSLRYFISWV